jgi:hypothetical protein
MANYAIQILEQERSRLLSAISDIDQALILLRKYLAETRNFKNTTGIVDRNKVGDIVERHRKMIGLSLRKLMVATGIPYSTISNIERGRSSLTTDQITLLIPTLGEKFFDELRECFFSDIPTI